MSQTQAPGIFPRAFRTAAFSFALALVFFGARSFFQSSRASTVDEEEDDPDYPRLFDDVARYLRIHYLDQERIGPRARKLTEKALAALENSVDEIYVENSDPADPLAVVHVGEKQKPISLARINGLEGGIEVLKDLMDFIKENYRGKRTLNEIRQALLNGFLGGLDPHTQVFNPKAFRDFSIHIEGEIFGVGMYVGSAKGTLMVRKVLKATPAERAGFKRGDRIVKIGEESTVNMDVNEAVKKIRGLEHTRIVLTVKRKESKGSENLLTLPIEVERERVTIPSVVGKLLRPSTKEPGAPPAPPEGEKAKPAENQPGDEKGPAVGYVQVQNFDKNTVPSLKETLQDLRTQNGDRDPEGLILDLRDNSGGLLQQASDMADLFITQGELYWIAQRGREEAKEARNDRREPRYPIFVLGNDLSASGAEIVIGALQKNHRAVVLGTPTFGKGSVQQLHPLREEWQLKITVSEYLIPGKISIQENGVIPDILAERAILNDKITNLFPNRRIGTERDYDDHIVSRFSKKEEPPEKLKYLYDFDDPDEVDDQESNESLASGEVDPAKDTLVQIALELTRCAIRDPQPPEGFRSDHFLKSHAAEIDAIRRGRFGDIVRRLKDRGIDWEQSKNPEAPRIELAIEHEAIEKPSTDKDDPVAKPFLRVKARVTSRADVPLYRVKGITQSDYYLYRDQEFLFGKILPGQTVERIAEMPIPYYPYSRSDMIRFAITEPGESDPAAKPLLERDYEVVLHAKDRPAFAYTATLVDRAKGTPLERLAPGAEATLKVKISNYGKAEAHKGVAFLRNQTGSELFLEPPGRIEFTRLAPGTDTEMEFAFRILPASAKKTYKLELGMSDPYSGESLWREIEIAAAGTDGPAFPNGQRFQPPNVEAAIAAKHPANGEGEKGAAAAETATLVTDQAEVELEAKVSGSQAPFNVYITDLPVSLHERDPDKVYFRASKGQDDLSLKARVPLKKGTNLIHVVTTDEHRLQNREVVVVRRN